MEGILRDEEFKAKSCHGLADRKAPKPAGRPLVEKSWLVFGRRVLSSNTYIQERAPPPSPTVSQPYLTSFSAAAASGAKASKTFAYPVLCCAVNILSRDAGIFCEHISRAGN